MADDTKAQKIQNFNKQNAAISAPANATVSTKNTTGDVSTQKTQVLQASDKATQVKAKAQDTQEAKAEKERQELEEKRQQDIQDKQHDLLMQAGKKVDDGQTAVANAASPFVTWLGKQPTYGGIGSLVAIIVFFLLAVVPVNANGDTRLKLIYLTLTGKTQLQYEGNVSSGDFGNSSNSSNSNNNNGNNTVIPIPVTPTPIIPFITPVTPTLPTNNVAVFPGSNGNSLLSSNDILSFLGFGE